MEAYFESGTFTDKKRVALKQLLIESGQTNELTLRNNVRRLAEILDPETKMCNEATILRKDVIMVS